MKAKEITVTYKFNPAKYEMVEIGGVFTLEENEIASVQMKEVFKGLKKIAKEITENYENK